MCSHTAYAQRSVTALSVRALCRFPMCPCDGHLTEEGRIYFGTAHHAGEGMVARPPPMAAAQLVTSQLIGKQKAHQKWGWITTKRAGGPSLHAKPPIPKVLHFSGWCHQLGSRCSNTGWWRTFQIQTTIGPKWIKSKCLSTNGRRNNLWPRMLFRL